MKRGFELKGSSSYLHIAYSNKPACPPHQDSLPNFSLEHGRKNILQIFCSLPLLLTPTSSFPPCLYFKYYLLAIHFNFRVPISFHLVRVLLLSFFFSDFHLKPGSTCSTSLLFSQGILYVDFHLRAPVQFLKFHYCSTAGSSALIAM